MCRTRLFIAALGALAIAGCTGQDDLDTDVLRSGQNGDSQACEDCANAVESCLVNHDNPEECGELYAACEDICFDDTPPPSDCDVCYAQFEECVDGAVNPDPTDPNQPGDPMDPNGEGGSDGEGEGEGGEEGNPDEPGEPNDPGECEQQLQECLEICEPPPPPPGECDHCEGQFEECLQSGQNPEECEGQFHECVQNCDPMDPPPNNCEDECVSWLEECVASGQDPQACEEEVHGCLQGCGDPGEPPPCDHCEEQLDECLNNPMGGNEEECWGQFDQCHMECAGEPNPNMCEAEYEECINDPSQDPGFCEELFGNCIGQC